MERKDGTNVDGKELCLGCWKSLDEFDYIVLLLEWPTGTTRGTTSLRHEE